MDRDDLVVCKEMIDKLFILMGNKLEKVPIETESVSRVMPEGYCSFQ